MQPDDVLLGRFRVEGLLRRGGMGEVWTAHDLETGRRVVVKKAHDSASAGMPSRERRQRRATLLKRFERECNLLERMDHSGIPRLLSRGFEGVDPYMVMEHIEGVALDEFLGRHTPPATAAAAIMTQLLEALAYAHAAGVVHRDVKPHNVIVDTEGIVHLIDFGIAFLTDPDATRYTEEGATPGSLGYKAPELIGGDGEVTIAADIYGVGCVYFMLLTKRRPFEGSPGHVEAQHLYAVAPRVSEIVGHVPPEIDEIIARMLDKNPAGRPTIEEIIKVIRPHLPRLGAPAPSPALIPDPTRVFRDPAGEDRPVAPARASRRGRSRRAPRPGADRPAREEYGLLVEQARKEIDAGEPGPVIERLAETLAYVRAAWGDYPPVARACLRCGDAARLEGIWARARARYREAEQQVARNLSAEAEVIRLEARIGLAECLVPEGRLEDAVAAWLGVARETLALDPVPEVLDTRLREVAPELIERGHGSVVQPVLDELSRRSRE